MPNSCKHVVSGVKLMLYGFGDGSTVNPTFTVNGKQVESFKLSLPEETTNGGILKTENIVCVAVFSKLVIILLFCPLKFELLVCALTKAVLEAALEDTFNKLEETEEDKYLGQTTLERSVAGSVMNALFNFTTKCIFDPIALTLAVSNGDREEVKLLLSKGADPNASLPLVGFTPLMEASRQGNVEIAGLLLDKGADPNRTKQEGWTALMAATNNGRYGTVDILLQKGANPDMQAHGGWSALMAAVYKHHDEVALRIIQAGATPHLQDENHTNAILLATATNEQDRVVEALLERVEDPSQLDLQDSDGETVLIFACKNRNLKLVKQLLSMKANPNLCNNLGETPVLIATKWGDTEIVQELLDNYADPNMGNTHPLMVAINLGRKEIAKLLVDRGANIYKEHEGGVLAFEMAELRNFTDLAKRLNPQQVATRTPRDVLRLTIKSMATVQKHLSLGPLMFVKTDDKKGWRLPGFLQHMFQRTHVQ
ncbi:Ankyrin homolog [Geodia barretti]|uniref:Ankyrin homolog n=1 Tax=Geodia barretti TaxID=519541 RepID=A0AA35W7B9_GEOBA|nr:Ankyrin homolog [Geodia barretti]